MYDRLHPNTDVQKTPEFCTGQRITVLQWLSHEVHSLCDMVSFFFLCVVAFNPTHFVYLSVRSMQSACEQVLLFGFPH